jgi:plasmid stability protein
MISPKVRSVSDILIRDVPDDVLSAIDSRAARLGISRSEYVRRRLAQDAVGASARVSVADLRAFGREFAGLADADAMIKAWE